MKPNRLNIALSLAMTLLTGTTLAQDMRSRLRPLGTSARSVPSSSIRQTSYLQAAGGFTMPDAMPTMDGPGPAATPSPTAVPPGGSPTLPSPGSVTPPAATMPPSSSITPSPAPAGASDLTPVPAPRLDGGFANVTNCPNVSPPSGYTAGAYFGCGVTPAAYAVAPTYVPPPAQVPAPAVMPPAAPVIATPPVAVVPTTAAPADALFSFGQQLYPVQVGPGLWGQPVGYVPGQPVRNWLRYVSP